MNDMKNICTAPWRRSEMRDSLEEFAALYKERPIRDNKQGMKSPHMFAVWFMARKVSPELVVESGILRGQSTWLLEQACPKATLVCLDPDLDKREYISDRAVYSTRDFSEQDWAQISSRSLVFFDDHQNAYTRLQQCKWFGFKHVIFEDNYPPIRGDCYSLKKAFSGAGLPPELRHQEENADSKLWRKFQGLARRVGVVSTPGSDQNCADEVPPNAVDSKILKKNLAVYYEFPPVFKPEKTRWGDNWCTETYPTPEPLLEAPTKTADQVFLDEAVFYTWICYAKLR